MEFLGDEPDLSPGKDPYLRRPTLELRKTGRTVYRNAKKKKSPEKF